ncbi:MAG: DUF1493 family protein [Bacteroidia bacterium]|nr:DUF1493 family protein [Bacteroidia bacterium]
MKNQEETLGRVIEFIYQKRWRYRKPLTLDTTLEKDLGITGDDGSEFMDAFFNEFQVNPANFDPGKHFGPEGLDPIGLVVWIRLLFTPGYRLPPSAHDIKLKDLVEAIEQGEWLY